MATAGISNSDSLCHRSHGSNRQARGAYPDRRHKAWRIHSAGLGDVTLLDYLRVPDVTTEHFDAVIDNTNTHTGRFFEVYWRTVAELAAIAEEISRFSEDVATI